MKQPDRSEVKKESSQPDVLDDLAVTQAQAEEIKAGTVTVAGTKGTFTLTFNGATTP